MKRVILCRLLFALAILIGTLTVTHAMNKRVTSARFTQSNMGTTCLSPEFLPQSCTPFVTGVICTTAFGSATRTWFRDQCITPYYLLH